MRRKRRMPKYPMPLFIYAYKLRPTTPRCCWMCQHFNPETAVCSKYNMTVPEDFAKKEDVCKDFIDENGIPW